jgi:hypothetical protein
MNKELIAEVSTNFKLYYDEDSLEFKSTLKEHPMPIGISYWNSRIFA